MKQGDLQKVLDYVLSSGAGNIKTRGNKTYKQVITNGTEYCYNREKPIANKLRTKLEQIAKTQKCKRYNILKRATKGIAVRKALKNMPSHGKPTSQRSEAHLNDMPTHIQ